MYTLAVLSGPFFAKPTAAGKAACVLYTCAAEADCRAVWDVADNNLTGMWCNGSSKARCLGAKQAILQPRHADSGGAPAAHADPGD
jgi:hypothetical protein